MFKDYYQTLGVSKTASAPEAQKEIGFGERK